MKKILKWCSIILVIPLVDYIIPIACRVDDAIMVYEMVNSTTENEKTDSMPFRTNIPGNRTNIVPCKACNATGIVSDSSRNDANTFYFTSCEVCSGSGFVNETACQQ